MPRVERLGLIGCGVVGRGFLHVLQENETWLRQKFRFFPRIVAIHDLRWGTVYDPSGLRPEAVLQTLEQGKRLETLGPNPFGPHAPSLIQQCEADAILELTPTDWQTGEPAATHIRTALQAKKHVVTTNKGPVALFYRELQRLAEENGVQFRFEGTVMAGTPLFSLVEWGLASPIRKISGIVNGTTNFILTQMETGQTYGEALREAQRMGYAEADPTADVEGYDALLKVLILANVLLGGDLKPRDVPCRGITGLSTAEVRRALAEGFRWKLLVRAEREEKGNIRAQVGPEKVPFSDPLSQVGGVLNALTLELEPLGAMTILGPGAGGRVTGHAVLSDLLAIHRS